jgi:hypothetical protein
VTALPHLLATFFVLSSLLAIISYANRGERGAWRYWLSFTFFTLAFLANEGTFVFAPLLVAAYALYATRWRNAPLRLILHALPFAALATGWLSFYQSCACDQIKFEGYSWGPHALENYALYLSFVAFPNGHMPLTPDALRWAVAGAFVAGAAVAALRGTHLVRIGVLGIGLALLPYAPVSIWTASRYTYVAVAFFAPAAAVIACAAFDAAFGPLCRAQPRFRTPLTVVAMLPVVAVGALYARQTATQEAKSVQYSERWELLASELQRNHRTVPPGTTIYIVDGPWTNPMEQYTWVPSVARALYGDAAAFALPRAAYAADPPDPTNALFLEWTGARLQPVPAESVLRDPPNGEIVRDE